MKHAIKLGVVCLTRSTFDYPAAGEIYKGILKDLRNLEQVDVLAVEEPIMDTQEAVKTGNLFAANLVDGLIVISGTFHLGHLLLEIKKRCDRPVLLWGLPELPYDGGKIRLNSVCGLNMNASNLVKSGITDFTYTVGDQVDENWVDAVRMIALLKQTKLGLIGSRAHGFFNVDIDDLALYGKFGCVLDYVTLGTLFDMPFDEKLAARHLERIKSFFDTSAVTEDKQRKVAELAAKFQALAEKEGFTALGIRCWPEFAPAFGIAPCAAMALAQDEGLIIACEGDMDCAVTMLCHKAAGAQTPYMADLSQVNALENDALMWHCGVAATGLADGVSTPSLDTYHAGGRGGTAGFVMKPGPINMARLDSIRGEYRLFTRRGEAIPMGKELAGTYAKVRFEDPMDKVLDDVIYSGLAHHVSMVYGDFTRAFEIFARLKDVPMI